MGSVGARLEGPGVRHAALRALVAVSLGIALSRTVLPLSPVLVAAAVGVALARPTRGRSLYLLLVAAALCYARARVPVLPSAPRSDVPVFHGAVVEEPGARTRDRMVVDVRGRGKVIVFLRDTSMVFRYGDLVRVRRPVERFDFPRNPGLVDRNAWYTEHGFAGRATASRADIRVLARGRGDWLTRRFTMPLRRHVARVGERWLPERERTLLDGVLVGDQAGLPADLRATFTDSGVFHILAVSGTNVGIVVGVMWLLASVLGIRGWGRFGAIAAAAVAYVIVTGARAPAARAGVMALAALAALPGQRRVEPSAGLGAAGILLLLWDPSWLFDAGFQLSFVAVLAIIGAVGRFGDLGRRLPGPRRLRRLVLPVVVSFAAFGGSAPLLLHHFDRVQLLAPVASLPAVGIVSVVLPLGLLVTALHAVSAAAAGIAAETLRACLAGLLAVASFFARQQWAIVEPGRVGWPAVLSVYGLALLAWNRRRPWCRTGLRVGLALGLNAWVWPAALARPVDRAVFLDPGRGDAVLLEDALGRRVLFDAGIDRTGVLRDYLRCRGIRRIDIAVITHPDIDHYGGLLDLGSRVRIGTALVATRKGGEVYERLLDRLRSRGTEVRVGQEGTGVRGFGFRVEFVWPEPQAQALYERAMASSNNVSLVARVEHSGFRMLMTGDMDDPALLAGRDVDVDLVKSPHHGSRKGNPDSLFEMTTPAYVVAMGRYPTPARLEERLAGMGNGYINTRSDGALTVTFERGSPVYRRLRSGF